MIADTIEGNVSITKTAAKIDVNPVTAFRMRHKLLHALGTYTDEHFKRHLNKGERERYYIKEHHEPIISREFFEKAEKIRKERTQKYKNTKERNNVYPFTSKLICSCCGHSLIRSRRDIRKNGVITHFVVWECSYHKDDRRQCDVNYVREKDIEHAFNVMLAKLIKFIMLIVRPLYDLAIDKESTDVTVILSKRKIMKEMEDYTKTEKASSFTIYQKDEIIKLWKYVARRELPKEFSNHLFEKFVDHAVVTDSRRIKFCLKCGLELEEVID